MLWSLHYGPQDSGTITNSVESVQLSTPQDPDFKIPIRDIVFHTTLLVPHRIEVQAEVPCPRQACEAQCRAWDTTARPALRRSESW